MLRHLCLVMLCLAMHLCASLPTEDGDGTIVLVCKKVKQFHSTTQSSDFSVKSFLLTLQTQKANTLAASISVKQAKTRMSRHVIGREESLPPPPKSHFLKIVPGLVKDLEAQTSQFKGIVHAFSNNCQLLVRKNQNHTGFRSWFLVIII